MKLEISNMKNKWAGLVLFMIILAAILVRTYKFEDYLYFKMDQSRDAILLTKAVENGPGYLPLLGARAGAVKLKRGFLRLGPIDYYFQYASGVFFHSTQPYVYAYPDLFFSILAIPLLFLFARLYFSKQNSLLITAMYAFSFLIIQYSRFAWNPNALQFFLLASFYGLLRFLVEPNARCQKWWLALWAASAAIGSQLHFVGFFCLVGVSGLLFCYHLRLWEKAQWKTCLQKPALKLFAQYTAIVLLIFLFFYTPVIISDVFKDGQNTHNFFEAMGSKAEKKPFLDKISKAGSENARYYCLLTTSQCIDGSLKKDVPQIILTGILIFVGLWLGIRKLKVTTDKTKRNFLILLLLWLGVFTILTIPLSFQLRPRFYIVVFAVPFLLIGLIFEFLEEKFGKKALWGVLALSALVIGLNAQGTYVWFKEQAKSQKSSFGVKRTLILKAKDGVTLGQLQGVTDWMYDRHIAGKNLYYYVKQEHVRPLDFLLLQKKDKSLKFSQAKVNGDANAQFFAILPAKTSPEQIKTKFGQAYTILASKQFGQLEVYEFALPNMVIDPGFKFPTSSNAEDRVYWKDVFGSKAKNSKK